MDIAVSPLAPKSVPELPEVAGVTLATAEAGVKYRNRPDVLLVSFSPKTTVAGVLTRSQCASAPVEWVKEHVANGTARALLVNAGNANAFTGVRGREAVIATANAVANALTCSPSEVMLASTGVIGEPLDPAHYTSLIADLSRDLRSDVWFDAARAIMTTDTFPKLAKAEVTLDGVPVKLNGIVKGSGMIAPNMATMLGFVMTDAPIAAPVLQRLLTRHCDKTFNCITVDGDTSTSDTVLAFATGEAGERKLAPIVSLDDPRLKTFEPVFADLLQDLALQVVRDGEGAHKLVEITVTGAKSGPSARRIGLAIANSPLVKTAIAGGDANWGRIVMAVGKAGEPADRDRLSIWFSDVRVATNGERDPSYDESVAAACVAGTEVKITVDVGIGRGKATVWTCDLTAQYISINADYRS